MLNERPSLPSKGPVGEPPGGPQCVEG
jgi:hypothetical protein